MEILEHGTTNEIVKEQNVVKRDGIRLFYNQHQKRIQAKMPNGEILPFVTDIEVESSIGSIITANIRVAVNVDELFK